MKRIQGPVQPTAPLLKKSAHGHGPFPEKRSIPPGRLFLCPPIYPPNHFGGGSPIPDLLPSPISIIPNPYPGAAARRRGGDGSTQQCSSGGGMLSVVVGSGCRDGPS
ncbi:hypothetical protein BRADI_2g19112v3 [Brachypodium distachyon]|uniref:Uncharacterized protein n=1 Tax=Brachypodium distachyon TaxID=15368 RepID=A0A0Q3IXW0_BRADI|nr:hypothetical protein BRADI_2g19112v3 [Brachypodium distachyon]KQK05275.1 hypothetical protein BRADI_2g19112v3 [Brachypodium distachyon]KQK05276.1 hypothetical protein BRADI_2g19112v3 [Brachypodium distachyon]